ncbi:MAG: peroxiredoxin [Acholeplasmataceae bacterium]|nr:peroxiredoxin [Acholeplasmataceae bacterium]
MKIGTYINFKLPDQNGQVRDLEEFKGSLTVIYFYPKDSTPGCIVQAKNYSDYYDEFKALGVDIIGVSGDDMISHQKFIKKQQIPFTLLTDEGLKEANKLGFAKEKNMFGNKFFGIIRSSLVLNEKNEVIMYNKNVKSREDTLQVLEFIKKYKEDNK